MAASQQIETSSIVLDLHIFCCELLNKNYIYSSEDLERFYFQYQTEALLTRETFSRRPINYSVDMSSDEKDRYIHYLVDKVNELSLDKRAMELGVEEFQMTFDSVNARLSELRKEMGKQREDMAEIRGELGRERNRRRQADAKARKFEQQLSKRPI